MLHFSRRFVCVNKLTMYTKIQLALNLIKSCQCQKINSGDALYKPKTTILIVMKDMRIIMFSSQWTELYKSSTPYMSNRKIGSLLLQTSPFWKLRSIGGKWSRVRSSLLKIRKISYCVFSVSHSLLYNKYYVLINAVGVRSIIKKIATESKRIKIRGVVHNLLNINIYNN